jgi:hypothetical protein
MAPNCEDGHELHEWTEWLPAARMATNCTNGSKSWGYGEEMRCPGERDLQVGER